MPQRDDGVTNPTDGAQVLLVEDDRAHAELLEEQLGEAPDAPAYNLVHVTSLRGALDHLASEDVDLILLDLGLPDSHGLSTLAKVVERAPDTPLVVLSGLDDPEIRRPERDARAHDYVATGRHTASDLARYIGESTARESVTPSSPRAAPAASDGPILLYDADTAMLLTVDTMLRTVGHRCIHAQDMAQLLESARSSEVRMVIVGFDAWIDEDTLLEHLHAATAAPIIGLHPPGSQQPRNPDVYWIPRPPTVGRLTEAIAHFS